MFLPCMARVGKELNTEHVKSEHGKELKQLLLASRNRQGGLECCSPRGRRVRYDWVTEQQQEIGKTGRQVEETHEDDPRIRMFIA